VEIAHILERFENPFNSAAQGPEAIETAFPKTQVLLCIVHPIRHSLK
jgi:transposase-like protein